METLCLSDLYSWKSDEDATKKIRLLSKWGKVNQNVSRSQLKKSAGYDIWRASLQSENLKLFSC